MALQPSCRSRGPSAISLRVANPYGPFQSPFRRQGLIAALIETMGAGRPVEVWGNGQVVRDYLYVEDLAQAMVVASLYGGPERVLNVGSGVGRSVFDVITSICEVFNLPPAEIIYKAGRQADVSMNVLDVTRIKQALGWSAQTSWAEGLRRTATWIEQTYRRNP